VHTCRGAWVELGWPVAAARCSPAAGGRRRLWRRRSGELQQRARAEEDQGSKEKVLVKLIWVEA
jgi:hypothetical protein